MEGKGFGNKKAVIGTVNAVNVRSKAGTESNH
jgi:hypothetical protein